MGLLAQERAVDSKSYLFDGSGGMRDQLEQAILNELEKKKYPLKTKLANVKSGGVIFGTKEQCVVIDCGGNTRIVIANTTVGTYLYVQIYLLIPFQVLTEHHWLMNQLMIFLRDNSEMLFLQLQLIR